MLVNKLKSVVLAATTIAVAMSVLFAAPASASQITLTADDLVVENGEGVTFTTNAPGGNLAVFFVAGEQTGFGSVENTPNPFSWDFVGPCTTITVTYRVYDVLFTGSDQEPPLFSDPYLATIDVDFVGDNTVDCNDTWGTGDSGAGDSGDSSEPLATTGSDASTVAGLTGVAGVVALAVAVAVSRRARRAQR
jgi:hypothetical protein